LPVITLPPFSPITDEHQARHSLLMQQAGAIIIPSIPFGPGNLRNLRAVAELPVSLPVLLLEGEPFSARDYSGGRAQALYDQIKKKGARTFSNGEVLLSYLEAKQPHV